MTSVPGEPPVVSPPDELGVLRARVAELEAALRARRASGRGRYGHEMAAAGLDTDLARLRARAERAEAALADQRRDTARAIRGLQAEVMLWRLRAQGMPAAEAAAQAGLTGASEA